MEQTQPAPPPQASPSRIRLGFLDGIRGWAALYVVFHHLGFEVDLLHRYPLLFSWMHHGRYAVTIFIALSGFCLMLPVANSKGGQLSGGFARFIQRRARRILPPYYAAFGFSLLVVLWSMLFHKATGQSIETDLAQFQAGNLITHALVVHHLSQEFCQYTNPPLWSVGTEWHIYFLFPALLLPVWRRLGVVAAVLAGVLVGLAPYYLLPAHLNLEWACPWYLGAFAFGMAAAVICFGQSNAMLSARNWKGWGWASAALAVGSYLLIARPFELGFAPPMWVADYAVGLATAALMVWLTQQSRAGRRGKLLEFFETPISERLGQFSYSIYLVHLPIWFLLSPISKKLSNWPWAAEGFRLFVGLPVALAGAWVFYLLVERRFVNAPAVKGA